MPSTRRSLAESIIVRCLLQNCNCLGKLEHGPWGGIVLVPVDGRGSFCVGCRRINPDWPQASALMRDLEQAINGTKYQEPTQEMVSPITLLLWQSRAQSRCRCGREPSPVADVEWTMHSILSEVFILRFWAPFSALMRTSRRRP